MMMLNKYILITFLSLCCISCVHVNKEEILESNEKVSISPDYSDICIPPNIAPLNFSININATRFLVEISGKENKIKIKSNSSKINIPIRKWRKLLENNKGGHIQIEIFCKDPKSGWIKYPVINNTVSKDEIDPYLAYRVIGPVYNYWTEMGLYQRNLENFDESAIITNNTTNNGCMNCHNFCMKDPNKFLFHTRGGTGTVLVLAKDGELKAINTKTEFNAPGAYPSWHPSGKLVAFSVNKLKQLFNSTSGESREIMDYNSNLIIYRIDSNFIETDHVIADNKQNETFPNWSPKGDYLYFCSAPKLDSTLGPNRILEEHYYKDIKYNLMRIEYDEETQKFGKLDTVINAAEIGKSLTIPRISPNNKYIIVCLSDWGNFPVHNKTTDLYIYNIDSMSLSKLPVNSGSVDSYHSWSSNSSWFVFSSKRLDDAFSKPFFSHIDEAGNVSKPFVLPQKDPEFYSLYTKNYNIPELIKDKIPYSQWDITNAATDTNSFINAVFKPSANIDQLTGETILIDSNPTSPNLPHVKLDLGEKQTNNNK